MRVSPAADAIYEHYKVRPGSEHIASANALSVLMWAMRRWPPRSVLEVGTGIGTITDALLGSVKRVTATEPNDFCVAQLHENLGDRMARVDLHDRYEDVPDLAVFGLIVVDGGDPVAYTQRLAAGGVVFIEGDRTPQREAILASGRPVVAATFVSSRRATPGGPTLPGQRWEGGCTVLKFEPTRSDLLRMRWAHLWNGRLVYKRRQLLALLRRDPGRDLADDERAERLGPGRR